MYLALTIGRKVRLHFKGNKEMNASLFNILSYGNAPSLKEGDTGSTSRRRHNVRTYQALSELFAKKDSDEACFLGFHEIIR
jgi:hypothetical protein